MAQRRIRHNRRKRQPVKWRSLGTRIMTGLKVTALGTTIVAGTTALSTMYIYCHDYLVQCDHFKASTINITGQRRLTKAEIMQHADIRPGENILAVQLHGARQRLEAHPWIAGAEVRRELPDRMYIRITEHQPLAVIDLGRKFLMNTSGIIFKSLEPGEAEGIPIINGLTFADVNTGDQPFSRPMQAVVEVLTLGRRPGVVLPNHQLQAIQVDHEIGLTLVAFTSERLIRLGYGDLERKYQRLASVLTYLGRQTRLADFALIDLKDPSRVVVQPRAQST